MIPHDCSYAMVCVGGPEERGCNLNQAEAWFHNGGGTHTMAMSATLFPPRARFSSVPALLPPPDHAI